MGRLVGVGATKAPKMYNAEEVAALTADLEAKVKELTETVETLNAEKTDLEAKVKELTETKKKSKSEE